MRITLLGTGTSVGIPFIGCNCAVCNSSDIKDKRLRTAALVETGNLTIAIDCGPDFRQQMLKHQVTRLDAILLTHAHKDHTGGLDDIRAFNVWQNKPMPVFATEPTQTILKKQYDYVFAENRYEGAPHVVLNTIEHQPFIIENQLTVTPVYAIHGNSPVVGFRIGNFTYLTDANFITPEEEAKIAGSELIVVNALRLTKHWSHFSLSEALELANRLQIPHTYFTHISHQMGLHRDVEQNLLPNHVRLGYDGLVLTL